tara:strand:+ start:1656 stop:2138 length:483 start_codon:yes stop_codon:yes gene_type:complete
MTLKKGNSIIGGYIPYFAVVLLISLPLVVHIKSFEGKNLVEVTLDKEKIQNRLLINTIVHQCFSYQDPITKRTYYGVIDMKKFTEKNLQKCVEGDLLVSLPERHSLASISSEGKFTTIAIGKAKQNQKTEQYPQFSSSKNSEREYVSVNNKMLRMVVSYA